jgi:hypothetical protein
MEGIFTSQRHRALTLAGVAIVLVLGSAVSAGARPAPARPTVDLGSAGGLAPDGRSVRVEVIASCPERWIVLEATVTVSQPQASGTAPFPLTCTGGARPFTVTVQSNGDPFRLGDAQATAIVRIQRGRTEQAQDSQVIQVDPTVFVELADTASLVGAGEAVLINVTTACPVGSNGQESYVNVSQGQALGNGTYLPICDGQLHTVTVRVQAAQGLFRLGSARALSFAFVEEGGDSFSGVDDNPIQIVAG